MRDIELYSRILGVVSPWVVSNVELDNTNKKVEIEIVHDGSQVHCPECGESCTKYGKAPKSWRHLDTCQFMTILTADVPRIECKTHGVLLLKVPWAERNSRFTAMMEALVIDWLKAANISSVASLTNLSWDEVDGILQRSVKRGLSRRKDSLPTQIGVDEKSFARRHDYVTIVSDQSTGHVIHIADDRKADSLTSFYKKFPQEELASIDTVSMDMHQPYISATRECVPEADEKIAFDKFHVAKHLSEAVDKVRRGENREFMKKGNDVLKNTKYQWLRNGRSLSTEQSRDFEKLKTKAVETSLAWAVKETAMGLWHYVSHPHAKSAWLKWCEWAKETELKPVVRVAHTVERHLGGILNAVVSGANNAQAEGINSIIQWIRYSARGFRNRERFKNAIYFHLGGLDLYPASLSR